jgi:hypothetical protein
VRHVGEELVLEFQLLFLTDLKGAQQPLAFDRIADRALQMFARDIAFDQVILHSLMYRLDGQPLVVLAGKHDYRDAWRVFEDTAKGFGAAAIGQVQVEQNHRGRFPGQRIEPLRQPADTIDLYRGFAFDQAQANQVCISWVVFDQQYVRGLGIHYCPILPLVAGLPCRTRILRSSSSPKKIRPDCRVFSRNNSRPFRSCAQYRCAVARW